VPAAWPEPGAQRSPANTDGSGSRPCPATELKADADLSAYEIREVRILGEGSRMNPRSLRPELRAQLRVSGRRPGQVAGTYWTTVGGLDLSLLNRKTDYPKLEAPVRHMSVRGNCIAARHTNGRGQRPYELLTCSSADLPLLRAGPLRPGGRVLAIYGPAPGACRRKIRPRADLFQRYYNH
jgi:hypothetical protein